MHPTLDDAAQPAPSRFAHLKTIEPSITASGITPGQALLDTPSPDNAPPVLQRYQRTRKPTARKLEASQSQPTVSKSRGKQPAKVTAASIKSSSKGLGNAGNPSTSQSNANPESQADGTGAEILSEDNHGDIEGGNDDMYISQAIIEKLEAMVGHSVSHLSNQQIKTLLDAAFETQEAALETQAEPSSTIEKSHAGVGLAGGHRNGSSVHNDAPLSQGLNATTNSDNVLGSQKRPLDALDISVLSKRVRISTEITDSATEGEPDIDLEPPRRGRSNTSDSESNSDSDASPDSDPDSDSEAEPPATALSQQRHHSAGSRVVKTPKATHPKPIPAAQSTTSSFHRASLVPTRPTPSTSSNNASTLRLPLNATTYSVHYPPPADLNDVDALAVWAIQRAQVLGRNLSNTAPHQPVPSDTTANHVVRAIATHRSHFRGSDHPSTQDTSSHSSQSTSTNPALSQAPTPNSDNTPTATADAASANRKTKRRPKSKLSDFPGYPGEVASAAIPYFLATVFADGAYENLEVFRDWALDAYRKTWELEYPEAEYEAPSKGLLVIMTRRASWLRGEVKKRIRVIIQYGYGFRNPATSRADIKHNRRLAKKLGTNAFHCRDLVPNANHFEHPEFVRAIGAGLFWDPESLGVVFRERFKIVPIPAVALVLTMMQACVGEWRTGSFKADELDADKQQVDYERHLLSLYEYEKAAKSRLTRYRGNWSVAGLEFSGTTKEEDANIVRSYIDASQIRPDTPPPEHDDEDLDN